MGPQMSSEMEKQSATPRRHRYSPGALDFSQIVGGASFGRPSMSEEEMEAINSGGAESAPKVSQRRVFMCCRGVGGSLSLSVSVLGGETSSEWRGYVRLRPLALQSPSYRCSYGDEMDFSLAA